MATDITSPSTWDWGNFLSTGVNVINNLQGQNAMNQAQGQIAKGLGSAAEYIKNSGQQAQQLIQPYTNMGMAAIQPYAQSAQNVGKQFTMQDYQSSPYWQVAQNAQKQAADQIAAQAGAKGMYGSGNMANALQQNALNTQLQMYDTAAQRELSRQQALNTALYQPVAMGQNAVLNVGRFGVDTANAMANLAAAQGNLSATGTLNRTAANQNLVSSLLSNPAMQNLLTAGGKALYDQIKGYVSSNQTVPQELVDQLANSTSFVGGDTNTYYDANGLPTGFLGADNVVYSYNDAATPIAYKAPDGTMYTYDNAANPIGMLDMSVPSF